MTTVIDLTAELAKLTMCHGRTPQTTSADRVGTSAQLAPYRDGAIFTASFPEKVPGNVTCRETSLCISLTAARRSTS